MKQIAALLSKDIQLDFRQMFGLGGIFLYVFAAAFIIYLSFGEVIGKTWVALYWIVVLFASVNAVLRSTTQEGNQRRIYYYTITDPVSVSLAKLIYNFLVLLIISLLCLLLFVVFNGYPIISSGYFFLGLLCGTVGIAANFTLISQIASYGKNSNTLMMVLSLPVIIPLLLPVIRLSIKSLEQVSWSQVQTDVTLLGAIDLLIVGVAILLFPFIWRS